jgi:hypothetical protein
MRALELVKKLLAENGIGLPTSTFSGISTSRAAVASAVVSRTFTICTDRGTSFRERVPTFSAIGRPWAKTSITWL